MYKLLFLLPLVLLPVFLLSASLTTEAILPMPPDNWKSSDLTALGYGCLSEPGSLQLPAKTVNVLLPSSAEIVSWQCKFGQTKNVFGEAPAQNSPFFDGTTRLGSGQPKNYQSSVSYLGLQKWGDLHYASFRVIPATWTGSTWEWHNTLKIELDYRIAKSEQGVIPANFNKSNYFCNPQQLSKWYSSSKTRDTEVLVIGTPALFNAMSAWVSYRQSQGITVSFTDISLALAQGVGADDAAKLRSYLQTTYSQNPFSYLLLLGDYDTVPIAFVTPEPDGLETVPTDFFYGDLSSNWDSDNDGRLGEYSTGYMNQDYEIDFTPEAFVGRISTNSATQVSAIASRIVAYEQSTEAWKRKNLLPAAFLNYAGEPEPNMPETDGGLYMELLCNTALAGMNNFTLYEQEGVVPSFPSDLALTSTNFRSQLNTESWGFINWSAHGSSGSSSRKVWMSDDNNNNLPENDEMAWQNLVTRQSFDNLNNSDGTVIFAASCYNGMIDANSTCLGEYALIKKAVGVLAATRTGWYKVGWQNPGWGGLSSYNYHFVENYRQSNSTLGASHGYANLLHTQYYLFGDPIDSGGIIWPELQNVYTYLLYGDPLVGFNPQPIVPQGEILVWEPVGNEGLSVVNAIRSISNMNVIYTDKLIVDYSYLNHFEAVFCLFNMPQNGIPAVQDSSFEYNYLLDYLNNGGKLYVEGYVDWNSSSELWQKLGTVAPYNGITHISTIRHIPSGMLWSYTAPEMYINMLEPNSASALPLFRNHTSEAFEPNISIWNSNANYRTVASSFLLSKIGETQNSLTSMVGIILDTLGVVNYQPVANDDPVQNQAPGIISLYPNPASSFVNLQYELKQPENLKIEIFNLKGQLVYAGTETSKAGIQNHRWNLCDEQGKRIANGIYFCRLTAGSAVRSAKLVVMH